MGGGRQIDAERSGRICRVFRKPAEHKLCRRARRIPDRSLFHTAIQARAT